MTDEPTQDDAKEDFENPSLICAAAEVFVRICRVTRMSPRETVACFGGVSPDGSTGSSSAKFPLVATRGAPKSFNNKICNGEYGNMTPRYGFPGAT